MRQALIARRMKRTFRDERGSDLHPSGVLAVGSRSAEEENSSAEEENSSEALPSPTQRHFEIRPRTDPLILVN
jgi:hypothetical protein